MRIEDPEDGMVWTIKNAGGTSEGQILYDISDFCTAEDLIALAAFLLQQEGRIQDFSSEAQALYGAFSRGKCFQEAEE